MNEGIEGILIQDAEAEADVAEEDVVVTPPEGSATDEDTKKMLREQLRKTLSYKTSKPGQGS